MDLWNAQMTILIVLAGMTEFDFGWGSAMVYAQMQGYCKCAEQCRGTHLWHLVMLGHFSSITLFLHSMSLAPRDRTCWHPASFESCMLGSALPRWALGRGSSCRNIARAKRSYKRRCRTPETVTGALLLPCACGHCYFLAPLRATCGPRPPMSKFFVDTVQRVLEDL